MNGQVARLSFLQLRVDACQELFGKACPVSASEHEPVRTIVAHEQGAKIALASFGERVPADYESLRLGNFDLNPDASTPAAFVDRIQSFRDQALKAKLLGHPEQVLVRALQPFRDPDIWRRFSENVGKEFPPGRKRFLTRVFPIYKEKIEHVINKRHALLGAFLILKQLKGRSAFVIERDDLTRYCCHEYGSFMLK
jgi:hypothetical protein